MSVCRIRPQVAMHNAEPFRGDPWRGSRPRAIGNRHREGSEHRTHYGARRVSKASLSRRPCVPKALGRSSVTPRPPPADAPPAIVPTPRLVPIEPNRRWAAHLQQIFEVDSLACPTCHGAIRLIALIIPPSVTDQMFVHVRTRACAAAPSGARSLSSTRRPSRPAAARRTAVTPHAR